MSNFCHSKSVLEGDSPLVPLHCIEKLSANSILWRQSAVKLFFPEQAIVWAFRKIVVLTQREIKMILKVWKKDGKWLQSKWWKAVENILRGIFFFFLGKDEEVESLFFSPCFSTPKIVPKSISLRPVEKYTHRINLPGQSNPRRIHKHTIIGLGILQFILQQYNEVSAKVLQQLLV